ncbi:MAG: NACHT domain-containing protein [Anaerolineales bacterium]|nr:NACHT domain-containing protein [Anaerolineales bacterium]
MPKFPSEKVVDFLLDFLPSLLPQPADSATKAIVGTFREKLDSLLKQPRLKRELLEAAQKAETDFRVKAREEFGSDEMTQAVASFPLFDRNSFQSTLRSLPSHLNEEILADHLTSYISDDWQGEFTPAKLREGTALYLNCIRIQLLHVEGFADLVTRLATLRIDQRTEQISENLNELLELLKAFLAHPAAKTHGEAFDDYLDSLRIYCENLPYLSLNNIYPHKSLGEIYIPIEFISKNEKGRKEKNENRDIAKKDEDKNLLFADILRASEPSHVLIVGEAGAGKSTLLRQTASSAWHEPEKISLDKPHLPLLLSLRSLVRFKGKDLEEVIRESLASTGIIVTQALPTGFFTEWPKLKKTKWLLLLDGLDEVPEENNIRAELITFLNNFLKKHDNIRIVITTRSSGYKPDDIDDAQFAQYEILPPNPEQTKKLAEQWFSTDAPNFLQALDRVSGGGFYETPLLMTIAAKVYGKRKKENGKGSLPASRSALYKEIVDTLINEAKARGMAKEIDSDLVDIVEHILEYLAWEMTKKAYPIGALEQKVAKILVKEFNIGKLIAEQRGVRFLNVIGRHSGILVRNGDSYGWLHPTFREYLAARYMLDKETENLDMNDYDSSPKVYSRFLYPNLEDVTLFAINILAWQGKDITPWVKGFYKSRGAITGGKALSQLGKVESVLKNKIIDELFAMARQDWRGGQSVALLGNLCAYYPEAKNALFNLVYEDDLADGSISEEAIILLGKAGYVDELLTLAHDTQLNPFLRNNATVALTKIPNQTDKAISAGLAITNDEKTLRFINQEFYRCIEKLEGREKDIVNILLAVIHNKRPESYQQRKAIESLGRLKRSSDLLTLVHDEHIETSLRIQSAKELLNFGHTDVVINILFKIATNVKNSPSDRRYAAELLGDTGLANKAIPILLELLHDVVAYEWDVSQGPEKMQKWGQENYAALAWNIVAKDKRWDDATRRVAVNSLMLMKHTESLKELAQDRQVNIEIRAHSAVALAELGYPNEAWELALDEHTHAEMRAYIALMLFEKILYGKLDSSYEINKLTSILQSSIDSKELSEVMYSIVSQAIKTIQQSRK